MTMAVTPSAEQEQRARWDQLLLDIETRTEQLRQMRPFEGYRIVVASAIAVFFAGAAIGGLLAHFLGR
jgi:hypothetical protein